MMIRGGRTAGHDLPRIWHAELAFIVFVVVSMIGDAVAADAGERRHSMSQGLKIFFSLKYVSQVKSGIVLSLLQHEEN